MFVREIQFGKAEDLSLVFLIYHTIQQQEPCKDETVTVRRNVEAGKGKTLAQWYNPYEGFGHSSCNVQGSANLKHLTVFPPLLFLLKEVKFCKISLYLYFDNLDFLSKVDVKDIWKTDRKDTGKEKGVFHWFTCKFLSLIHI